MEHYQYERKQILDALERDFFWLPKKLLWDYISRTRHIIIYAIELKYFYKETSLVVNRVILFAYWTAPLRKKMAPVSLKISNGSVPAGAKR